MIDETSFINEIAYIVDIPAPPSPPARAPLRWILGVLDLLPNLHEVRDTIDMIKRWIESGEEPTAKDWRAIVVRCNTDNLDYETSEYHAKEAIKALAESLRDDDAGLLEEFVELARLAASYEANELRDALDMNDHSEVAAECFKEDIAKLYLETCDIKENPDDQPASA